MRKLCEFGHVEQVKDLLDVLPTGERAEMAKCALEAAIPANSNDIVWLAMQYTKPSKTVFHAAAAAGNADLVRAILIDNRSPRFVNHVGPAGTALCEAASGGHSAVVELLLDVAGVDINVRSFDQRTAFVCAAAALSLKSLRLIASHGGAALANDFMQINSGFHLMCSSLSTSFDDELFSFFLSFPVLDVNAILQNGTVLFNAVVARNETLIRQLLTIDRIDPNICDTNGDTVLIQAATSGSLECMQLLAAFPKTNFNHKNLLHETALSTAASHGFDEIVRFLIKYSPVESSLIRSLIWGITHNYEAIVRLLCLLDFNINRKVKLFTRRENKLIEPSKASPLGAAGSSGNVFSVNLVLSHPHFDPIASRLNMFIFDVVKSGNFQLFQQLLQVIGNDLSMRDDNNQRLLARICGHRMSQMLHYVMALPTFHGIERGDIDSVVTEMFTSDFEEAVTIVAGFPGVDLNAPLRSKRAPPVIAAVSMRSLSP
jgi:ankyrin repeat protein